MPYFMVDDQLHINPKAAGLAERALGNDLTGIAALGLWTMAGSVVQASLNDGKISRIQCVKILLNETAADMLAQILVSAGLWHAPGHTCDRCQSVPEGHFLYHDWKDLKYDSGSNVKLKRAKSNELKDPELIAAVWARDAEDFPHCTRGRCRYCQEMLNRKTSRGIKRPTMDHVDPLLAVGSSNIVLACMECNQKKGRRTPEVAGMTLHPAPVRKNQSAPSSPILAPTGSQSAAPDHGKLAPAGSQGSHASTDSNVQPQGQDLAATFGLRLPGHTPTTAASAAQPSSPLLAPNGSQSAAPARATSSPQNGPQGFAEDAQGDAPLSQALAPQGPQDAAPDYHMEWEPEAAKYLPREDQEPTRSGISKEPDPIPEAKAVLGRAYAGTGMAGQGRGGLTLGSSEGQPDETTHLPKPRRSRSRRRSKKKQDPVQAVQPSPAPRHTQLPEHHAGDAPAVLTGGRFGSAWHGHHGKRDTPPESVCTEHNLDLPCWKCQNAAEYLNGDQDA